MPDRTFPSAPRAVAYATAEDHEIVISGFPAFRAGPAIEHGQAPQPADGASDGRTYREGRRTASETIACHQASMAGATDPTNLRLGL
jgi:hypothetical protein